MSDFEGDTAEMDDLKTLAEHFFATEQPRFEVNFAAGTHRGKVRPTNEDHYAIIRRTRGCEILSTNLQRDTVAFPEDQAYFLVVADGIGGAACGEVASQLALNTMLELSCRITSWVMKYEESDTQDLQRRVDAYVEHIQQKFRQSSQDDPRLTGMGTTLTCAYLLPPHLILVHIGDSRAYLHRGGQLKQITHDQTVAQAMIDMGAPPEDVKRFGHVLTNSLGGDRDEVTAEVSHVELQAGDRLMLCTDGLSGMVDDVILAEILQADELQPVCDRLIREALDQGGRDNITVVLCDLRKMEASDHTPCKA